MLHLSNCRITTYYLRLYPASLFCISRIHTYTRTLLSNVAPLAFFVFCCICMWHLFIVFHCCLYFNVVLLCYIYTHMLHLCIAFLSLFFLDSSLCCTFVASFIGLLLCLHFYVASVFQVAPLYYQFVFPSCAFLGRISSLRYWRFHCLHSFMFHPFICFPFAKMYHFCCVFVCIWIFHISLQGLWDYFLIVS